MKSFSAALLCLVVVVAAAMLACNGAVVSAWTCTTSVQCDAAGTPPAAAIPATRRCGAAYWQGNKLANIKDQFNYCLDNDAQCCTDPCTLRSDRTSCLALVESGSPLCIFMPFSSTSYACIAKQKLCLLLKPAECSKLALCAQDNVTNTCGLRASFSVAEISAASVSACPALAGVVVAFLVLMFLCLVGAIIFVVVVVVMKQKKADEEEKKAAEEAAAAEAAAKAQQQDQDF